MACTMGAGVLSGRALGYFKMNAFLKYQLNLIQIFIKLLFYLDCSLTVIPIFSTKNLSINNWEGKLNSNQIQSKNETFSL
jgi:hypothetical protein